MKTILAFIILIAVGVYFLPNLASTQMGNKLIRSYLHKQTGIEIESAQFSWSGPQVLQNITYTNDQKKIAVSELTFEKGQFLLTDIRIWVRDHHLRGNQISLDLGPNADIPFFDFSWEKVNAPHMTLKFGKFAWQNFGAMADLLNLIQLKIRANADIPLWFQDTPCSIKDGILHLERTEFLVDNNYEFALWNDINLSKETFNLTLGIPRSTLQKVLDISYLPKNYTVPLRFTGPFNNPELHKSSALRTIAKLLLLKQLPLAPFPQTKATPPPRPPFPWS